MTTSSTKPFAVVTGASSGIEFELAKQSAENGYDLLIVSETPKIEGAAADLKSFGTVVESVQLDLAKCFDGIDAGKDQVVAGSFKNKVQTVAANALPDPSIASMHRSQSEPGSTKK